jgi:hypothetical protein
MNIEVIPLSRLQTDPQRVLSDCCDSGQSVVVELPDHRFVAIQPIEPTDGGDSLVDDLLANNPAFRAKVQKSKDSPRKPFGG